MKRKTSHTLYSVGFLWNTLVVLGSALVVIGASITLTNGHSAAEMARGLGHSVAAVKQILNVISLLSFATFFVNMGIQVLALIQKDHIKKSNARIAPCTIFILMGIVGVNAFYLIGGIIGLGESPEDDSVNYHPEQHREMDYYQDPMQ